MPSNSTRVRHYGVCCTRHLGLYVCSPALTLQRAERVPRSLVPYCKRVVDQLVGDGGRGVGGGDGGNDESGGIPELSRFVRTFQECNYRSRTKKKKSEEKDDM